MTDKELLKWLDDLSVRRQRVAKTDYEHLYHEHQASAWLTEAETALAAGFPSNHPIRTSWRGILARTKEHKVPELGYEKTFDAAGGVINAAREIVASGRLQSLLEGVRAETVFELLDQSGFLLKQGYVVAAAVIAGGALETHLLHLCNSRGIQWSGEGSISKYNNAIGQARNQSNEVYSMTDGKLVEGWGGLRNDAAHDPASFKRTEEEVRLMLEGIKQFVARVK